MNTLFKSVTVILAATLISSLASETAEAGRFGRSRGGSGYSNRSFRSNRSFGSGRSNSRFSNNSSMRSRFNNSNPTMKKSFQNRMKSGTSNSFRNKLQNNNMKSQIFKNQSGKFGGPANNKFFGKMSKSKGTFNKFYKGKFHNHGWGHRRHFHGGWKNMLYRRIYRPYYFRPFIPRGGFYYSCNPVSYCNPYCTNVVVDNNAPFYDDSMQLAGRNDLVKSSDSGDKAFEAAREAFYNGNLELALEQINDAAKAMSGNPDVHQFRSLIFFALKDYKRAAAAAYTALTISPGWDWNTLKSTFPKAEIYTELLRALETETEKNDQDVASKFLLAYHYLMLGHPDEAATELKIVVEREQNNDVAKQLLNMLDKRSQTPGAASAAPVLPPAPEE